MRPFRLSLTIAILIAGSCLLRGQASPNMAPVSYTHLDVYKRQVDQRLKKYARLGAAAVGRAGNDKAFGALGCSAESKLLGTREDFSGGFKPIFAKNRYQARDRFSFHTKQDVYKRQKWAVTTDRKSVV